MGLKLIKNSLLVFCLLYYFIGWPQASQPLHEDVSNPDVRFLNHLALVHDANTAQQKIRFYVKGYREKMVDLFTQAIDPQTKIYIANAYTIHEWAHDHHKNFNTISSHNLLESFAITCESRNCLRYIHTAIRPKMDSDHLNFLSYKIYNEALESNTIFSELLRILHYKVGSLGFLQAARLRPYVGLCYPEIMYYYGQSLISSSPVGSALHLEGLYYVAHSGLIENIYIKNSQTHSDLTEHRNYRVAIPVQGQALSDIKCSMINVFAQPAHFLKLYKIMTNPIMLSHLDIFSCCNESFLHWIFQKIKSRKLSGCCVFEGNIYKFRQYRKSKRSRKFNHIGTVSIDIDTYENNRFKLCESFRGEDHTSQLIINFYEDFLTRSGSPQSLVNLHRTVAMFKIRQTA